MPIKQVCRSCHSGVVPIVPLLESWEGSRDYYTHHEFFTCF